MWKETVRRKGGIMERRNRKKDKENKKGERRKRNE
jgi:hypothetical protein